MFIYVFHTQENRIDFNCKRLNKKKKKNGRTQNIRLRFTYVVELKYSIF